MIFEKKIRKKINELKKEIKKYYELDVYYKYEIEAKNLAKIEVLEEMLNENKNN